MERIRNICLDINFMRSILIKCRKFICIDLIIAEIYSEKENN